MKEVLIATYKRNDTYRGYSKINHYHVPTEIRCYVIDNSDERELGILVNGKPCEDGYDVVEYNYKGQATYRHHFTSKEEANSCFLNIINKFGDFVKVS